MLKKKDTLRKKRFFLSSFLTSFFLFLISFFLPLTSSAFAEAKAERIVSINLCTDELLLSLAEPENIRAVTGYPHRPEVAETLLRAPHIQRNAGRFETVLPHRPDLVVAGLFSHRETVQLLERVKIPVFLVPLPEDIEDVYQNIRLLAGRLGEAEKGEAVLQKMQTRLESLKTPAENRPRAVLWGPGGHVPGAETYENAALEAAGARNIAAEMGIKGHSQLSVEDLVHARPDVVILSTGSSEKHSLSAQMLFHPAVHRALPNVRIISLPPDTLHCASPLIVETIEWIAEQLTAVSSQSSAKS